MFERFKDMVGKRKKAMTPEDEPVRESNETQEYRDAQTRKKEDQAIRKGYKKGGFVRSADGCAARGKTKGRII
jgi:hypothetical protein